MPHMFYRIDEGKKITRCTELERRGQRTVIWIKTKLIIMKISTVILEQEVGHLK